MDKDVLPRLRVDPLPHPPRVVLVEPEIPQNTGSIGRLTAALQCRLHLVGLLGFQIDDKAVRRAGLDYWPLVELEQHRDFEHFVVAYPRSRVLLFSAVAAHSYLDVRYRPDDALVFGGESDGLPAELLARHATATYAIPTVGQVRSLNLSCAVSVVLFEAYRQLGAFDRPVAGTSQETT